MNVEPRGPGLTKEMLPAVRAAVVRRNIWMAVGFLVFWGIINSLGILMISLGSGEPGSDPALANSAPLTVVDYVGLAIGPVMLLMGLYGTVTRRPGTILLAGVCVLCVGIWNLFFMLWTLDIKSAEAPSNPFWLAIGIFQIVWAIQEMKRYGIVRSWLAEIVSVTAEQRKAMADHITAFTMADEDYFQWRIKAFLNDVGFFVRGVRRSCRGQLLDDVAILITKNRRQCLCIQRRDAAIGKYNNNSAARVQTDHGPRRLTFGELSVISFKQWAGVGVTEKDLRRAISKKKASAALLSSFAAAGPTRFRVLALGALATFRKDPQAAQVATACLDDADADIRAAATKACTALRVEALHDKAVAMLRDVHPDVRAAAADYISSFPTADAAQPLSAACQAEMDARVRRRMNKALKACQRAGANPYALH